METYQLGRAKRFVHALEPAEPWRADHAAAMRCRDLEAWMADCRYALSCVRDSDQSVRAAAAAGQYTANELAKYEQDVTGLFLAWHVMAAATLPDLAATEEAFSDVTGATEFRADVAAVGELLAGWNIPAGATWGDLASRMMTAQEVRDIAAIMSAPPGGPGTLTLTPAGIPLVTRQVIH